MKSTRVDSLRVESDEPWSLITPPAWRSVRVVFFLLLMERGLSNEK